MSPSGMVFDAWSSRAANASFCNLKRATSGTLFPRTGEGLADLGEEKFVLDGIVIFDDEQLSFDGLLLRNHPAESRIRKLSVETPTTLMCFDPLVDVEPNC
jgi:ATP-dependent DNA ligase